MSVDTKSVDDSSVVVFIDTASKDTSLKPPTEVEISVKENIMMRP